MHGPFGWVSVAPGTRTSQQLSQPFKNRLMYCSEDVGARAALSWQVRETLGPGKGRNARVLKAGVPVLPVLDKSTKPGNDYVTLWDHNTL